jgi:hypothetical protein
MALSLEGDRVFTTIRNQAGDVMGLGLIFWNCYILGDGGDRQGLFWALSRQ